MYAILTYILTGYLVLAFFTTICDENGDIGGMYTNLRKSSSNLKKNISSTPIPIDNFGTIRG